MFRSHIGETSQARALQALVARGHTLAVGRLGTSANSILLTPEGPVGAADSRSRGALAVGH